MTIKELINNIIPYYNKYRQNKNDITGTEAVEILWFIGDFLKQYIEESDIILSSNLKLIKKIRF